MAQPTKRVAREIFGHLPDGTAIEFLETLDAARYVDNGPLANPALALDFSTQDTAFSTSVPFTQLTLPWSQSSAYLSVYNVGVPGANAYEMTHVITPAGTTIKISAGTAANQNMVTLSPGFQFTYGSPGKRVYLVSGPVSYLCNAAAGTLTRYSGYGISSTQPTSAPSGSTASLVAADVGSCLFTYSAGTAQRNGLVTLTLQLTQSNESVKLLYEVQVVNSP